MATKTRHLRPLAERLVEVEQSRQRLMKAKAKEDAKTKRREAAAVVADEQLRGKVTERRRKAAWEANPELAQAELALLDQELTDQDERRVFGLQPLNDVVQSEPRTEDGLSAPDKNCDGSESERTIAVAPESSAHHEERDGSLVTTNEVT